ncbi:MAG: YciI family protein [Phycisphaerales bacterium]
MIRLTLVTILASTLVLFAACATRGNADASYVFTYLKSGPASATNTREQKQEIFKGHMANMKRLAEERKLIIAGPYADPADPTWRGLFIFDTPSVDEARKLVATDPGVVAGEFVAECIPLRATARLREFYDIFKAEDAKRSTSPRDPTQPPPIRAYVIVTARDSAKAEAALAAASLDRSIIWWGRFAGSASPGGVYVIDAKEASEVRAKLGQGPWVVDGWWSDTLVEKVPRISID